ncbi:hypothetical protein [Streptomyces incanus]|uniref:Uncharacterized protein n=1 Tax=Streptomyces incanus TaxID=887453 RepID=A0ABW0Y347_9ACTN
MRDSERRLRQRTVEFKELRESDKAEIALLRTDRETLVRAVHRLSVENRRLRAEPTAPDARVRVPPTRPCG